MTSTTLLRFRAAAMVTLLLGCGPAPGTSDTIATGGCDSDGCGTTSVGAMSSSSTGASSQTTASPATSSTTASSTTTSTSISTSTSTSTVTTDGCEFICDTDPCSFAPAGARCTPVSCDPYAQDCPEDEKCVPYDWDDDGEPDDTKCVPVMGDGQIGESCTADEWSNDDCALGLLCWNGACVEMCQGTPANPICPPDGTCVLDDNGTRPLCLTSCDPLLQDCEPGETCVPTHDGEDFACQPDESGGVTPTGSPCEKNTQCNPGHLCAPTELFPAPGCDEGGSCCAPYCDVYDGEPSCEDLPIPGLECVSYFEPGQQPGVLTIGVCVLP